MKYTMTSIMTIYNTEKHYVIRAIESFLKFANHDKEELIIIDDCSTNDYSWINQYKKDNIYFERLSKNTRRVGAFQKGIDLAKGKYIKSFDSDDFFRKKHEQLLEYLDKNNYSVVFHQYYSFNEKNNSFSKRKHKVSKINNLFFKRSACPLIYQMGAYNAILLNNDSLKSSNSGIKAPIDDHWFISKVLTESSSIDYYNGADSAFFVYMDKQEDRDVNHTIKGVAKNFNSVLNILEKQIENSKGPYYVFTAYLLIKSLEVKKSDENKKLLINVLKDVQLNCSSIRIVGTNRIKVVKKFIKNFS